MKIMRPKNKHERFEVGLRKGTKRAKALTMDITTTNDPSKRDRLVNKFKGHLKDTTKMCSCEMCCNPRRRGDLTRQEIIQNMKDKDENI